MRQENEYFPNIFNDNFYPFEEKISGPLFHRIALGFVFQKIEKQTIKN